MQVFVPLHALTAPIGMIGGPSLLLPLLSSAWSLENFGLSKMECCTMNQFNLFINILLIESDCTFCSRFHLCSPRWCLDKQDILPFASRQPMEPNPPPLCWWVWEVGSCCLSFYFVPRVMLFISEYAGGKDHKLLVAWFSNGEFKVLSNPLLSSHHCQLLPGHKLVIQNNSQ